MRKSLVLILLLFTFVFPLNSAGNYDGLWFLGYNQKSQAFSSQNGLKLREAINLAIDRDHLCTKIMQAPYLPDSFIPLGMLGYEKQEMFYEYSPEKARMIIKNNENLKKIRVLRLLYTDGVKTEKVAKKIQDDLAQIGIDLVLDPVNYSKARLFEEKLKAGNYDLFLLGYKTKTGATQEFLTGLFTYQGEANFFNINDPKLEELCGKEFNTSGNAATFQEIQKLLWEQQALLPIFYIERF